MKPAEERIGFGLCPMALQERPMLLIHSMVHEQDTILCPLCGSMGVSLTGLPIQVINHLDQFSMNAFVCFSFPLSFGPSMGWGGSGGGGFNLVSSALGGNACVCIYTYKYKYIYIYICIYYDIATNHSSVGREKDCSGKISKIHP